MEWLTKEIEKDKKEIARDKEKLIKQITSLNKDEIIKEIKSSNKAEKMFKKNQLTFLKKLQIILGYGKKG